MAKKTPPPPKRGLLATLIFGAPKSTGRNLNGRDRDRGGWFDAAPARPQQRNRTCGVCGRAMQWNDTNCRVPHPQRIRR